MSISQCRTFLKQQIKLVCPDLKEWRDSFNIENIPSTLLNSYYHISYGVITSTRQTGAVIDDDLSCTVTIFKRGNDDISKTSDEILDIAHCIRMKVLDPKALFTNNLIAAKYTSMRSEELSESNDNIVKISIEFNLLLSFANY